jgi:L-lactate dehydrogenase (cytochrome)
MGAMGLIYPDAELDLAQAASEAGILPSLSSYSSRSPADVAKACPGPKIYQVYMLADPGLACENLQLAKEHGYTAIAVTIDTAAQQARDAFERWNVFGLGGGVPWRTKLEFARHPRWLRSQRLFRDGPTDIERRAKARGMPLSPTFLDDLIRKDVTWDDVARLAASWDGPVAVKGIMRADDARRAADVGATAIIVCNHGGIPMDGAPPSLDMIADIRAEVGDAVEIIQSGGLRRGSGIAKAIALGADACMTGRPFAYGLAAGGKGGVEQVIKLFRRDYIDTMRLCGCRTIADVRRLELRFPARHVPGGSR